MSLYDDIEIAEPEKKKPALYNDSGTSSAPTTSKINLNFLKTQLEAKKALLQNAHKSTTSATPSPVVNLSSGQQKPKSLLNLKPRKALPLPIDSSSTFTIVPKALKEEKVFLFGEVTIEDEYNPTAPTDYATFKQKREAQKLKEKVAKEVADRIHQEHAEEEAKRRVGAAIAPPPALIQQDSNIETAACPSSLASTESLIDASTHFGKGTTRGLGIAANIMSKMGYRHGTGLGRTQQGISSALRIEKTGKNAGVIRPHDEENGSSNTRNEELFFDDEEVVAVENKVLLKTPTGFTGMSSSGGGGGMVGAASITEKLKFPSKIVLLKNLVTPGEVDLDLETEVKDEMKKYGQLNNVIVHVMPNSSVDEAVRIFLEFANVAQATKAIIDLNGRFFGGRAIYAAFYSFEEYTDRRLDK